MAKLSPFNRLHPPRFVNVLGYKITVRVVSYLEDSEEELLGAFNPESKEIYLLKGCDWKSVLLHEMTHGILYYSGASQGISASKEEQICLAIETGLSHFFT